jgi:catalase
MSSNLFRLMNAEQMQQLIDNLVGALKPVPKSIQVRQIGHFYKADPDYGGRVATGLGIPMDESIGKAA